MTTPGIVLAAGRSRRMGATKALLPLEGGTFLSRWVEALREGGCAPVLVVVGAGAEGERVAEAARRAGAEVVVNPAPAAEQIDSLRLALRALPPAAEAAVVTPVDVAGASAAVVAALLAARGAAIVLPTHAGVRGHPTRFARAVFAELLEGDLPEGARSVVLADPARVEEVPVAEPRVLLDVDTPAEYRRLGEAP